MPISNQNPGADPGTYWGDPWPVGEYTVTFTVDTWKYYL